MRRPIDRCSGRKSCAKTPKSGVLAEAFGRKLDLSYVSQKFQVYKRRYTRQAFRNFFCERGRLRELRKCLITESRYCARAAKVGFRGFGAARIDDAGNADGHINS